MSSRSVDMNVNGLVDFSVVIDGFSRFGSVRGTPFSLRSFHSLTLSAVSRYSLLSQPVAPMCLVRNGALKRIVRVERLLRCARQICDFKHHTLLGLR